MQSVNTPRGTVLVSTPEATAVDLVGYPAHAGGLDHVATVLAGLLDPDKLVAAARTSPLPWAQRLGHLLVKAGRGERAEPLKSFVRHNAHQSAVLVPAMPRGEAYRDDDWKLVVNADVESEL